jgi:hypothetical protein
MMVRGVCCVVVALAVALGASAARAAELPRLLVDFTVTGNDVMAPGAPYVVRGTLAVAPGAVLTILPGTIVRFDRDARLLSDGDLRAQSPARDIVLQSNLPNPAPGSWLGVELGEASRFTLLDGVLIEHASAAVLVGLGDAQGTYAIRRCVLRNFSLYGVQSGVPVTGRRGQATRMTGTIADNLFENPSAGGGEGLGYFGLPALEATARLAVTGNTFRGLLIGVTLDTFSPVLTGNRIEQNQIGLKLLRGAPLVTGGNRIVGNGVGIQRMGGRESRPIVNGNEISGNTTLDYESVSSPSSPDAYRAELFQNAERNYWGTTDPLEIAAKVSLASGIGRRPVDFVPFLDANGELVPEDNLLLGVVTPSAGSGSTRVIAAGSDVLVLGSVLVPAGITLEIGAGSTVSVSPDQGLGVDGTLRILGRPGALVSMVPLSATWRGIDIRPGSVGSSIDGAVLERTRVAVPSNLRASIDVREAELLLRDSRVSDFTSTAVLYRDQSQGLIERTVIENPGGRFGRRGIGIQIDGSSPTVRSSEVRGVDIGLDFLDASTSLVTGNRITGNDTGIRLRGGNNGSPFPRINGNDLFMNFASASQVQNLLLTGDSLTQTATLDARGNYWLATTEPEIRATIRPSAGDVLTAPVDISGFARAPLNP